jgi:cell division septation protein DedD
MKKSNQSMSTLDPPAAPEPIAQDNSGLSVMAALYRAGIGPIFQEYYLSIFIRFEKAHRGGLSWNLAACMYTLNWLIFRRLWGAAVAYAAILICAGEVIRRMDPPPWDWSDPARILAGLGLLALYYLIPGFFGNWVLYAVMRKKVERALVASSTLSETRTTLAAWASNRRRFVGLAVINGALMCAALGVYWMFQREGAFAPLLPVEALVSQVAISPATALPASASTSAVAPASAAMPVSAEVPASASGVASATPPASAVQPISAVLPASAPEALRASAPASVASLPMPLADKSVPEPRAIPLPKPQHALVEAAQAASGPVHAAPYFINVGLFANDWNARYAQAKLIKAEVVSFRHALMTAKGKLTRIRAGPYDSQEEADATAKTIQALGLEAVVIRP